MLPFIKKENNIGVKEIRDYKMLILNAYFVAVNIKSLSFIGDTMIAKPALHGFIYTLLSSTSLSDITNINSYLDNINAVDMLLLMGSEKEIEIYKNQYESHVISKEFIEVRFKNGNVERILFN